VVAIRSKSPEPVAPAPPEKPTPRAASPDVPAAANAMDSKAASPALLPQTTVPSPPRASDRRTQRRHCVDTTATILFIDVGARAHGRIMDLSMSGCRIRTDERFPVGIYRRIETEFRLDGLPFRLGGVVQSLHDRHTVGIRFLDLSQRKQGQLAELIEEIDAARQSADPVDTGDETVAPQVPSPGNS
jgi:hypothetical protein